jgi:hypothetical protein
MDLGNQFWRQIDWSRVDWYDLRGFQSVEDLIADASIVDHGVEIAEHFEQLANFVTPIEQHYAPFFYWHQLCNEGFARSSEAKNLAKELAKQDPAILSLIQQVDQIKPVIGDQRECPVSYIELPDIDFARLRKGELITSPYSRNVLLFWKPAFNEERVWLSDL